MPIPGPGTAISMTTIATEFGGTVPHSLSEYYRGGGLVPNAPVNAAIPTSGQIAMGNFYGSTNRIPIALNLTSNTYNYDVFTNRGPTYVAGISDVTVTVNPGVTVGSTSTGTYAMLVPSGFNPGDTVRIVNNGVIQAMGGGGGNGQAPTSSVPTPGLVGGDAIYVNRPTIITNNSVVAGGGGGGGGGAAGRGPGPKFVPVTGGGGGGGGAGFNGGAGGAGGGNGGGAGSPGTSPAGGSGGGGWVSGGPGGGRGAAGTNSTAAGGAGGRYIVGNPFVTWPATGTRNGGVA